MKNNLTPKDVFAALVLPKENYLARQTVNMNSKASFPTDLVYELGTVISSTRQESVMISGGDYRARAEVFLNILVRDQNSLKLVLHTGNPLFDIENLRRRGIKANHWDINVSGDNRGKLLGILTNTQGGLDLALFYLFAMDVCEALRRPINMRELLDIDWVGGSWQQELIASANRDVAIDLLARYDKSMASMTAKAVCEMEKVYKLPGPRGVTFDEMVKNQGILVGKLNGSSTYMAKRYLDVVQDAVERGLSVSVYMDDVVVKDHALIHDMVMNKRLVLGYSDVMGTVKEVFPFRGQFNYLVLKHNNASSACLISKKCFGEFNKKLSSYSIASPSKRSLFKKSSGTKTLSIQESKDYRLDPNKIAGLEYNEVLFRLVDGSEGKICL